MDKKPETVIEIASYFGRIQLRKWPQYVGTLLSSMTQMSIGIIMAFSAILVPQLSTDENLMPSPEHQSLLVSITTAGIILGCALSSVLLRFMGPRRLMMLQSVPSILAWVMVAMANDIRVIICGRMLVSFLNAITLACFSKYVCEIAAPSARGLLCAVPEVFCSLGLLLGYSLGALLHWSHLALLLGTLPNVIMLVGFFFMPEAPGWLTSHCQFELAMQSYRFYRGDDFPADREIQAAMDRAEKTEDRGGLKLVLRKMCEREALVPILLATGVMVFQVLSGMLAVLSYAVTIFQISGTPINEYLCAIVLGVTRLICNILASAFADRFGRRQLMMTSALVSALGLIMLGTYFCLQGADLLPAWSGIGWLPVIALLLYMSAVSLGIAPVTWILLGELVPSSVSAIANGIILTVWGLVYFGVLQMFPWMTRTLGPHGTFWLFAGCCLGLVAYMALLVPETRGVELQDIQKMFRAGGAGRRDKKLEDGANHTDLYGAVPTPGNALQVEDAASMVYVRKRTESCRGDFITPAAN